MESRLAPPRPCKHFMKGRCRYGDTCHFSHDVERPPKRQKPDNPKRRHPASRACCPFCWQNHCVIVDPGAEGATEGHAAQARAGLSPTDAAARALCCVLTCRLKRFASSDRCCCNPSAGWFSWMRRIAVRSSRAPHDREAYTETRQEQKPKVDPPARAREVRGNTIQYR